MLGAFLEKLLPYLPYIAFGAIVLGVIVIVCLVLVAAAAIKRSAKNRALARPQTVSVAEEKKPKGMNSFFWAIHRFKERWGWLDKDEMSQSFKRTMAILKTYLSDRDPQYELPWYLLLGSQDSGKTTLLNDVDLEMPIGSPEYEIQGDDAKLNWYFFNQGILIDAKGALVLEKAGLNNNDEDWQYLLRLFNRFRPKRPIDGVILTIPADELFGESHLSKNEITERAHVISEKLNKLVNFLAMQVPVYVIVTKCDLIPGFDSFVTETPTQNQQQIFGWSSPYSIDTGYNQGWVDELFSYMHRYINRTRDAIFSEGKTHDERDGVFLFPIEFSNLKPNLGNYLNSIFKISEYHEPFFLRGVYFCGQADVSDIAADALFELNEPQRLGDLLEEEKLIGLDDPLAQSIKKRVIYLRDLFERKIFPEASLAKPNIRLIASTNRLLNFVKASAVGLTTAWIIGLFYSHNILKEKATDIVPTLNIIEQSISGVNQRQDLSENNTEMMHFLDHHSQLILSDFSSMKTTSTKSFFIPISWISILDQRIGQCLTAAYSKVILPSLYGALVRKTKSITDINTIPELSRTARKELIVNPTQSQSFHNLKEYVANIRALEHFSNTYNTLEEKRNVQDFSELINYLYETPVSTDFHRNFDYYMSALKIATETPMDLQPFQVMAGEKLGILYRNFLKQAFNIRKNYPLIFNFETSICSLSDVKNHQNVDGLDLRKTVDQAIALADMASQGTWNWVDNQLFNPSQDYKIVMDRIAASNLFGTQMSEELLKITNQDFQKFKIDLAKFKSPLTGSFFEIRNGQVVSNPSPGLIEFIDTMSGFLKESFMDRVAKVHFTYKVPPGKLLFWDDMILKKSLDVVDDYTQFTQHSLVKMPIKYQKLTLTLGQNNVRELIMASFAQAQNFQDLPEGMTAFALREMLHSQIQNIITVAPYFGKLLTVFEKGHNLVKNAKLREFFITQSYQLLERTEALLDSENLYSVDQDSLRQWDGEPILAYLAFDVPDENNLAAYLTAQRGRITYLAREMAEPLLMMLNLGFLEDIPVDLPLANRWARIVSTINDYEKKTPGNTLKILEDYILQELNDITLENCMARVEDERNFESGGDYFLEVRHRLEVSALKRCQSIIGKSSNERYDRLSSFFNENLANRFPFTKHNRYDSLEADPEDVRTFFELFNSLTTSELDILSTSKDYNNSHGSAGEFIKQIQSIRGITMAAVDLGLEGQKSMMVNFDLEFRTDRKKEVGGDQIIDWALEVGDNIIDFRAKKNQGSWKSGDPITLSFRWANDAYTAPTTDNAQDALSVIGNTAIYSYNGRWSLIRLLRDHMITDQQFKNHPIPILLEFKIPTIRKAKIDSDEEADEEDVDEPTLITNKIPPYSKVFLRLALHTPEKPKKNAKKAAPAKGTKLMMLPRFPTQAPVF